MSNPKALKPTPKKSAPKEKGTDAKPLQQWRKWIVPIAIGTVVVLFLLLVGVGTVGAIGYTIHRNQQAARNRANQQEIDSWRNPPAQVQQGQPNLNDSPGNRSNRGLDALFER